MLYSISIVIIQFFAAYIIRNCFWSSADVFDENHAIIVVSSFNLKANSLVTLMIAETRKKPIPTAKIVLKYIMNDSIYSYTISNFKLRYETH